MHLRHANEGDYTVVSTVGDDIRDCKKYVVWVVFKTSLKEFCPRVPKDVISWKLVVSWIVIFVINVCSCDVIVWLSGTFFYSFISNCQDRRGLRVFQVPCEHNVVIMIFDIVTIIALVSQGHELHYFYIWHKWIWYIDGYRAFYRFYIAGFLRPCVR